MRLVCPFKTNDDNNFNILSKSMAELNIHAASNLLFCEYVVTGNENRNSDLRHETNQHVHDVIITTFR